MEESVVARYERGPLRCLFNRGCLLTNHPGSGNNWAVGHYEHGTEQKDSILEILRRKAECCDYLHGFLLLFSLGGGTGSGLGSSLLPLLKDQFPSVDRLVACVHPGVYNDVITSPYNTALTLRKLSQYATCVFPVDNKALNDICSRLKPTRDLKPNVPYEDMNSLIVKMLLNLTSGCRFPGPLNLDLNELSTNMTPFEGLHYLTSSFSPFETNGFVVKESELLNSVCHRNNQLLRVDPFSDTILSATLLCRGDLSLSTCRDFVDRFSKKAKFPSWNPTGVKTALCSVPLIDTEKSLLCLTNSTAVTNLFQDTLENFSKLYKKKAHVHHYVNVNGFEKEEFNLAALSLADTMEKYSLAHKKIEIPRLQLV